MAVVAGLRVRDCTGRLHLDGMDFLDDPGIVVFDKDAVFAGISLDMGFKKQQHATPLDSRRNPA